MEVGRQHNEAGKFYLEGTSVKSFGFCDGPILGFSNKKLLCLIALRYRADM
jgi:hypothetical protein